MSSIYGDVETFVSDGHPLVQTLVLPLIQCSNVPGTPAYSRISTICRSSRVKDMSMDEVLMVDAQKDGCPMDVLMCVRTPARESLHIVEFLLYAGLHFLGLGLGRQP